MIYQSVTVFTWKVPSKSTVEGCTSVPGGGGGGGRWDQGAGVAKLLTPVVGVGVGGGMPSGKAVPALCLWDPLHLGNY